MIIIGEQLKKLAYQHEIVENVENSFDGFSLELTLADTIKRFVVPKEIKLRLDETINPKYLKQESLNGFLDLERYQAVLACSRETVKIPLGYLGFIQTKGTLARHFVTIACFDGQIDPGFSGKVTFEIIAMGSHGVVIPVGAKVARMFIVKCSTKVSASYNGKYSDSEVPTHPLV